MNAVASGSWLTSERVRAVALISGLAGIAMLAILFAGGGGTVDPFGQPVGSDFTAFWNAGRIANSGQAPSAYDPAILNADVHATHGVDYAMAWVYPPTFLFVASPLARLPYVSALLLWQTLSLSALALVLNAILQDRRALLVALASPLTPMVLAGGQNAFLSAALLGLGLHLLDHRPWATGSVFAALTYKPQLGLGIAPLLLIERNWRAIAASAVATGVLIALSVLQWGTATWAAFPDGLANGRTWMEQGTSGFYKSASLFSAMRLWGASIPLSYAVQGLGMMSGLFVIWRAAAAPAPVRNAGICAAVALATPYLMDYDMASVGIGAAFLYAQGRRRGFRPYERSVIAFVWLAPWFSRPAAEHLLLPLGPTATILLAGLVLSRTGLGIYSARLWPAARSFGRSSVERICRINPARHRPAKAPIDSPRASGNGRNAARLANTTMYLGLGVTALFLFTAAVRGLRLSIRGGPALLTFAWVGALCWVRRRHDRPGGEERFATAAGVILVLFGGGLAGGLICLVGQTFGRPFIDPLLHRADLTLGIDIGSVIRGVVSIPGLPALLAVAYNSSFPLIFASLLAFAWTERGERAWELCGVFNLCLLAATISSAIFPATGPFHYLPIPAALQNVLPAGAGTYHLADLFALRRAAHFVIDPTKLQGVAVFPSFHVMLALMTAAAWRNIPRISVAMCTWQGVVILSAIPIGGHYIIDLVAGAVCWALAHFLWHRGVAFIGMLKASPCHH